MNSSTTIENKFEIDLGSVWEDRWEDLGLYITESNTIATGFQIAVFFHLSRDAAAQRPIVGELNIGVVIHAFAEIDVIVIPDGVEIEIVESVAEYPPVI